MKQVALFSVIVSLVFACAAPTGAVFALDEPAADPPGTFEIPFEKIVDDETTSEELKETPPDIEKIDEGEPVPIQEFSDEEPLTETVPSPNPPVVVAPEVVLPASQLFITAYKASGAHLHAVQLYNNSSEMISLEGVSLLYIAEGDEYAVPLVSGWVEPRSYIVIAWQGESEFADIEFMFDEVGEGQIEAIELHREGHQLVAVAVPAGYAGELLHRFKSTAGNYTTNLTFASGDKTISGGGLYALPDIPDLSVREVLVNPRDCTYGQETPDCYDFIKLRNDGSEPLDLSRYRLRSGYSNTSSTATNTTYFDDILAPGEMQTLTHDKDGKRVGFPANGGTVWLEDVYGFVSFDLEVPPYIDSHLTSHTGRSWAYNDDKGEWQWATPSPFETENDFSEPAEAGKGENEPQGLVPCKDNQYRSEETNRCRNIATPSVLKPCREGQYRSEETNRCRSIAATAASILKPCADDQFRNPLTNRCKKIASSEDIALADCGEGRERNPETNRCRNVLGASSLADTVPFPVEKTPEGSDYFAGWWTIGIIAALGLSYGVWEWREELLGAGRRAHQFVGRKK